MKMKLWVVVLLPVLAACAASESKQPDSRAVFERAPLTSSNQYAKPPAGTPDGAFSTTDSNGRVLKSVVRGGVFDEFVDVYHPNGKLHSHTPMKNGAAQGWSQGYTEQGVLRTRVLYENGRVVKTQLLDEKGKVLRQQVR